MGMVQWWTLLWISWYCHTLSAEDSATLAWEWDREPTANKTLIYNNTAHIIIHSAEQYISMETDKERFSFDVYDGNKFPLRISPVKFGDSGSYICDYDGHVVAAVTLVTIRVSAEPPGGLSRNQSVVLNCEISRVINSVTLAWLRMKGGRGELVKQEVLTERPPKTMLSLTLPSLTEDQLHWACVVFTGSVLRAQVNLSQPSLRSDQSSKALQDQCNANGLISRNQQNCVVSPV
ncbi:hypothetical protein COCON_G00054890 [Conger conger]|uniref:Ig-like domain-containing protein n=1 Tax=Conger conger TaxID=82655 RepID=A0A9Q1DW67_CONCO|nr:hypothetical protein COCON_G00054890 [Conger conger]